MTGCICVCAERFVTGSVFESPAAPPYPFESRVPPPPPPRGDELSIVPHDAMLVLLCVRDDGRLFPFAESEAGLVFFESSVHVSACFP